jgi:hypothetical protein
VSVQLARVLRPAQRGESTVRRDVRRVKQLARLSLPPSGGYGRALKAAHSFGHALFEGYVPSTLLFVGGQDHAALQRTYLATAGPADFRQVPHALHFTSHSDPDFGAAG